MDRRTAVSGFRRGPRGYLTRQHQACIAAALPPPVAQLQALQTLLVAAAVEQPAPEPVANLGTSPMAYVRERRLQEAAALLRPGHTEVTSVAALVGYTSLSAFSNAFHRRFGRSPSSMVGRDEPGVQPGHASDPRPSPSGSSA